MMPVTLNRRLLLFVLTIAAGAALSLAQEGYRIDEVSFSGNLTFEEGILSEKLLFPAVGWFSRTFSSEEPSLFSAENLTGEAQSILHFYQEEGFLHATVEGSVAVQDDDAQTVELMFTIVEGDSVTVGSVGILFLDGDSVESSLRDTLQLMMSEASVLQTGLRFRDQQVASDQESLLRVLNDNGFPYSIVHHVVDLSEDERTADILWNIHAGGLGYFGDYFIQGVEHYDEDLITDRIRFTEGELYQHSLLEETQRDIYDLGLYRVVSIKALLGEQEADKIPIVINITESSQYRLQMGVGYGRDEKFRVSGRIDVLGILGTAGQVSLEVKRSDLEPFTLFVSYVHPDFIFDKARFSISPFLRREDEPGYEARRAGYEVNLSKPLGRSFYGAVGYAFESVDLYRTPAIALPPEFRTSYPKESVILTFGYASARPLFSPSTGISAAVSSTFSGLNLVQSDEYRFTRLLFDFRYYTTPQRLIVLAARLKLGSIRSIETDAGNFVPFEERFYAGGSISIRGWSRSTLGPLDPAGNPIGGSSLLESGVELRIPYTSPLHGVVFLDAGNVWETPLTFKLNDLGYSVGAGIRYATPIGPLRFDVAHQLFRGSQELQWWFSIGHAF